MDIVIALILFFYQFLFLITSRELDFRLADIILHLAVA